MLGFVLVGFSHEDLAKYFCQMHLLCYIKPSLFLLGYSFIFNEPTLEIVSYRCNTVMINLNIKFKYITFSFDFLPFFNESICYSILFVCNFNKQFLILLF